MRGPILAVGLLSTATTALFTLFLFYVVAIEYSGPLGYALAGAAIAGPLLGAIAGANSKRWGPLITGAALGALILIAMYSIVRFNYYSP